MNPTDQHTGWTILAVAALAFALGALTVLRRIAYNHAR